MSEGPDRKPGVWASLKRIVDTLLATVQNHGRLVTFHSIQSGEKPATGVSRQAAAKLMQPLLDAGLVRRVGSRKSGRSILA